MLLHLQLKGFFINDAENAFYKHAQYTVSEDHRTYLLSQVDLAAKNENGLIPFVFKDNVTAIKGVNVETAKTADDAYYTISGVKVSKPTTKGIYVKNGKKIVVK